MGAFPEAFGFFSTPYEIEYYQKNILKKTKKYIKKY
jgi:hypothetical protein